MCNSRSLATRRHDGSTGPYPGRVTSLETLDATALAVALRRAPQRLVPYVDDVLERVRHTDAELCAFRTITAERARREATALADLDEQSRCAAPLFGVPVAVKECLALTGEITGLGGRAMVHPEPADDPLVARLTGGGAVLVGAARMSELGQEPWTRGAWGMTTNPVNPLASPGGSSGGSAVAVAAGLVPIAIGVDSGGSVRIPAACTSVFGFKPTNDRWNDSWTPDMWAGLGSIGVFARSLRDVALVDAVVTSDEAPAGVPAALRIGVCTTSPLPGIAALHPAVRRGLDQAVARWRDAGHQVRPVALPMVPERVYGALFFAGMAAMAGQVDRPDKLEPRTRLTAAAGRLVIRAGSHRRRRADADAVRERVDEMLADIDVLVTPVLSGLPPAARPVPTSLRTSLAGSRPLVANTALFNLTGHPALSVPVGEAGGPPVGLQLVGARQQDRRLLAAAQRLIGDGGPGSGDAGGVP